MNKYVTKFLTVLLLVTAVLTQSAAAFAQGGGNKPGGHRPPPGIGGTVASIDADAGTLTVEVERGPRQGTWAVATTEETVYQVKDVENATLADIVVGDFVEVRGKTNNNDKTITAKGIRVMPPKADEGNAKVGGEITAIDGSSLTITTRNDEVFTILTDENTQYRAGRDKEISFADLKVGDKVMAHGDAVEGQENTILAKVIGLKPVEQSDR